MNTKTIEKISQREIKNISVPESLKPKRLELSYTPACDGLIDLISSQHSLINVWLVVSFLSISVLSVLLFII